MLESIKIYVGTNLYKFLQYYQKKDLEKGSSIHKSVFLNKVHLKGKIKVEEYARILGGVYISGKVSIGKYTSLNGPNLDIIAGINEVKIGKFCSIARNVSIQEFNHKLDSITTFLIFKRIFRDKEISDLTSKGSIIIGNDVWIGAHSVILSGVKIGDGAVIAANSVVTKDVPSYGIVGGNPAKFIKHRFSNEIQVRLDELKWWEWEEEKIKKNKDLFIEDLTLEKLEKII